MGRLLQILAAVLLIGAACSAPKPKQGDLVMSTGGASGDSPGDACFCPNLSDEAWTTEVALQCLCEHMDCPRLDAVQSLFKQDCGEFQSFGYLYWGPNWYQFKGDQLVGVYLSTDYPAYCGNISLSAGVTSCRPLWPPDPEPQPDCNGGASASPMALGGFGGCSWK